MNREDRYYRSSRFIYGKSEVGLDPGSDLREALGSFRLGHKADQGPAEVRFFYR